MKSKEETYWGDIRVAQAVVGVVGAEAAHEDKKNVLLELQKSVQALIDIGVRNEGCVEELEGLKLKIETSIADNVAIAAKPKSTLQAFPDAAAERQRESYISDVTAIS